jgi:hypothetical protein
MPKSEKYKKAQARSKEKKRLRKDAAIQKWKDCCYSQLEPWDCFCSWGCDSCNKSFKCKICDKLYDRQEVSSLNTNI